MTPDTPTAAPAPSRAEKINRAIAEKVNGWKIHEPLWRRDGSVIATDDDNALLEYSPMTDAGQAFELVERYRLNVVNFGAERPWNVSPSPPLMDVLNDDSVQHPDLKHAICLVVLRMHGVDPEDMT